MRRSLHLLLLWTVLVVRILARVQLTQAFRLVDEWLPFGRAQHLPALAEVLRDDRVVHVGRHLADLTPLDLAPHHERVHRPFDVSGAVFFRLCCIGVGRAGVLIHHLGAEDGRRRELLLRPHRIHLAVRQRTDHLIVLRDHHFLPNHLHHLHTSARENPMEASLQPGGHWVALFLCQRANRNLNLCDTFLPSFTPSSFFFQNHSGRGRSFYTRGFAFFGQARETFLTLSLHCQAHLRPDVPFFSVINARSDVSAPFALLALAFAGCFRFTLLIAHVLSLLYFFAFYFSILEPTFTLLGAH